MRLLVVNWQDWTNPLAGGAEVYLYEIFSRLVKRGHHVTLLVSRPDGSPRHESLEGFEVFRIGRRLDFNFHVPGAVRALLRHNRYDIIVDDVNKVPFYTPVCTRKKHFGMMMHLFRREIYHEVGPVQATYVYLAETLIGLAYRHTRFAVLSESSRQDLMALGLPARNIEIVYCGIDHDKYRFAPGKKEPGLIVCVGRLKRYKSVHHLLQAVPLIAGRRNGFRVVIVGDGDARKELIRNVRSLDIERYVEFKYDASEREKVDLYQRAWILVQPSVKEGWGLTVIEAGACGTPSVAARSPGLVESVKDGRTGFLYPYGDIARLTDRVVDLMENRAQWEKMSRAARHWAAEFSWDRSAEQLENVLQDCIRGTR